MTLKHRIQELTHGLNPKSWSQRIKYKGGGLYEEIIAQTSYLPNNCKFAERYYHILNDITSVPTCKMCNNTVKYLDSNRGYHIYCSVACSLSDTDIQNKITQTKLEKYGSTSHFHNEEVKEKIKQTNLKRYGVENVFQSENTKEKIKQTNLKKYGVDHNLKSESIKTKIKQTNLKRYGAEYPTQSKEVIETRKQNNLKKYGVESPSSLLEIRDKVKSTCKEKYNVEHYNQTNLTDSFLSLIDDEIAFQKAIDGLSVIDFKEIYGGELSTIYRYIKKYNLVYNKNSYSTEKAIINILSEFNITTYTINDRKTIYPLELDFYLPDHNLAIEVCGLYWHSEINGGKDKKYHYNKWKLCTEKGIQLITIFSDELHTKFDIVKNRLRHILKKQTKKIHARKCQIKEISTSDARIFCEKHHIQGYVNSSIKIGSFHNDVLVAVMTFGRKRKIMGSKTKTNEYELLRYCASYNINGIASRMFKKFVSKYQPNTIISYCDLRWGTGNLYEHLGFTFLYNTPPNYWYTKDYKKREYRYKYTKHKLLEQGNDTKLSEWEIMKSLNYDRVWDCGNGKYEWRK